MHYDTSKFSLDDLLQEARMAATNAVNEFDENNGVKISTYVYCSVRNCLISFIQKNAHDVYIAPSKQSQIIKRAKDNKEEVSFKNYMAVRIDNGEYDLSETIPSGSMPALDRMINEENKQILREELTTLPKRERDILVARFFDGKKFREIAADYNLSKQRIDQIAQVAMGKLKIKLGQRLK